MRATLKTTVFRAPSVVPGLPQLWTEGAWYGLALAIAFACTLNVALAATFVWTEWLTPSATSACWVAVVVLLAGGSWLTYRQGYWSESDEVPAVDLFPAAQGEYLRSNWFEAENLCRQILARDDHDVEAHLMLSSVLRRTGRTTDAARQLELLASLQAAEPWHFEIAREVDLVKTTATTDTAAKVAGEEDALEGRQVRRAA
jgi:hypothetical protein